MLLHRLLIASAFALASNSAVAQSTPEIELWRLDCGTLDVELGMFSDTGLYAGEKRTLAASCYLVKNGDRYLLWDTGVDGALA